ncbi:MAG: hypothetical protein R3A80_03400 [Bdellovibrionota bacterium]
MMGRVLPSYWLKLKGVRVCIILFYIALTSVKASALFGGVDCGKSDLSNLNSVCQGLASQASLNPVMGLRAKKCAMCSSVVATAIGQCQSKHGAAAGVAALSAIQGLGSAQAGNFSAVESQAGTTTTAAGAGTAPTDSANLNSGGACQACGPECMGIVEQIRGKMLRASGDAGLAAGNAAQTGAAAGGLMEKMGPAIIGAGLGAALGYMLGKGGDESSSSAATEEPPELAPPPESGEGEVASSESSSSTGVGNSSSSSGIDTPAVVQIPTSDPNAEGGRGDSEILVAANDAIIEGDDGTLADNGRDVEDGAVVVDDGSGDVAGSTSGGGTTGNGSEVVDAGGDLGASNGDEVIVVDDMALVGSQRGLAGGIPYTLPTFGTPENPLAEKNEQGKAGETVMMLGVPSTSRGLSATKKGGKNSSAATSAASKSDTKTPTGQAPSRGAASNSDGASRGLTSGQSSSISMFGRSREAIQADLRKRGLIE